MTFNATAARAARRETLGDTWAFELDGDTFTLPTELTRATARALRQLDDRDVDGLLRLLLGDEQFERFDKHEVTMRDIAAILEAYGTETGLGMGPEPERPEELLQIDAILRDYGIEYPLGARGVKDLVNMARLLREDRQRIEGERDGAYRERAHLVALLAAMTDGAVITYAPDVDEPGWQIVYLTLDGRQASWHIAPRDADLFTHVERVEHDDPRAPWDRHTTEEKYAGIAAWTAELAQRCGPACSEQHTETGRCEIARDR